MDSNPPPSLDLSIQEAFLDTLYTNLSFFDAHITSSDGGPSEPRGKQEVPLLLRLLQFELSFQNTWSPKTKEVMPKISSSLFNLALVSGFSSELIAILHWFQTCGTSDTLDPVTYPLIIDTLYYICDGKSRVGRA